MATKNVTDENFETEVLKSSKLTLVDFWTQVRATSAYIYANTGYIPLSYFHLQPPRTPLQRFALNLPVSHAT